MKKIIDPYPPYDMNQVLRKCRHEPQFIVCEEEKELSFPVRVKADRKAPKFKKAVVFLKSLGTVDQPQVHLNIAGQQRLTSAEIEWVIEHVNRRFQFQSQALPLFYKAVRDSKRLNKLTQQLRGLPFIQYEGIFEGFVQTIIQQQVHFQFARQLTYTLAKTFGETIEANGNVYPLLPTPEQLAQVEVENLHSRKFSRRKAEYLIGLARMITNKTLDLDALAGLSNASFLERMTQVRGIGVWTAECVLLFCLGRKDVFPAGDIGLQKAIQRLEGCARRPTADECREWIKPYAEWASYIAVYLWGLLGE